MSEEKKDMRLIKSCEYSNLQPDKDGFYTVILTDEKVDRATANILRGFAKDLPYKKIYSEYNHPTGTDVNRYLSIDIRNIIVRIERIFNNKSKWFIKFSVVDKEKFDNVNKNKNFMFGLRGLMRHNDTAKLIEIITFDLVEKDLDINKN